MIRICFFFHPVFNRILYFAVLIICIFIFEACTAMKSQLCISKFRFEYEGETYKIRSIASETQEESYNELSSNKFLAVDFDQDRIIDKIVLGDAKLADVQRVYEEGLAQLAKEQKLEVRISSVHRFTHENTESYMEIKSFRPPNANPFNEFKIVARKQLVNPPVLVLIDRNADGKLDGILKGTCTLDIAQSRYAELIETGLNQQKLEKINGMILVREK